MVVIGARPQINKAIRESGSEPRYEQGYRVTDALSLQAAIRASGQARMEVESRLSKVGGECRLGGLAGYHTDVLADQRQMGSLWMPSLVGAGSSDLFSASVPPVLPSTGMLLTSP